MNLKTKITKLHYTKEPKGVFYLTLKFCSLFYGIASGIKNFLYDAKIIKPKKVSANVISVGNFTTGGVGKTPVVAEIAKYFIKNGEKTAIISRGYGGKLNTKKVNLISDGINLYHNAAESGDEPYWHAVTLDGCAVLTCSNRFLAAKYAVEKLGVKNIILDDGFQHRKFYRNFNIVLVDSEKIFGNGNLLPSGPLRESLNGIKRVDKLVIVSKNTEHSGAEELARSICEAHKVKTVLCKIEPDYAYNIISGEHLEKGAEVTALSAIGQPEQFYAFLENDYDVKKKITFDDHHQYIFDDIKNVEGKIITTEKDAVKLAAFGRDNTFALKLKTVLNVEDLLSAD